MAALQTRGFEAVWWDKRRYVGLLLKTSISVVLIFALENVSFYSFLDFFSPLFSPVHINCLPVLFLCYFLIFHEYTWQQEILISCDICSIGASTFILQCKHKVNVVKRLPVSSSAPQPPNQQGLECFLWLDSSSISWQSLRDSFICIPACLNNSLTWLLTTTTATDLLLSVEH